VLPTFAKGKSLFVLMSKRCLSTLDPKDNVLIALADLRKGDQISFCWVRSTRCKRTSRKTQVCYRGSVDWCECKNVRRDRGKTVEPIVRGRTSHHAKYSSSDRRISPRTDTVPNWTPPDVSRWRQREFYGYQRADGQVAREIIWVVVPLVFCENRNIAVLTGV